MIVVCMKCQMQLAVKPGRGVSHGLCRLHFLTTVVESQIATAAEHQELKDLQERRRLT